MTDTFTLTGRILDKSKAPVARARLVLASNTAVLRDPDSDEVYAPPPRVTTDDDGYLVVAENGEPAAETGVPLIVGVQYSLRGVSPQLLGGTLVFTAPDADETLDIADVIPEPPASDPTWSDALAALSERVDAVSTAAEEIVAAVDLDELIPRSEVEALIAAEAAARDAAIQAILDALTSNPVTPLSENTADPGTFSILAPSVFYEDPDDEGTYINESNRLNEDPADPGIYLIGA